MALQTQVKDKTRQKVLLKGTEAICRGALMAGCRHYYGYPITPQNEVAEYMARAMPETGGVFLQTDSELAAINMVFGAAAAGHRALTSTSGPGYSLMLEGLTWIAGAETPCVLAMVMRVGPGGSIETTQLDYGSVTKGGGHGGIRNLVLAPASIQELFDLTQIAFDLAEQYRITAVVLSDTSLAQMMEPVELGRVELAGPRPPKDWALTSRGRRGMGPARIVSPVYGPPGEAEAFHDHLQEKYARLAEHETRYESYLVQDAELVVVAFGSAARSVLPAIHQARREGRRVGLLRPITLFPYPYAPLAALAAAGRHFLVVEGNKGQMLLDVRLAAESRVPITHLGQAEGAIEPERVYEEILRASEVR